MARLPTPGGDSGAWGQVLNSFLEVGHNADGSLKNVVYQGDLILNVKNYGAVGDNATDDTAAIQATINALPAAGGAVYFPAGTYKITSALTLRNSLTLKGDDSSASVIHQTNTTANGLNGVDILYLGINGLRIVGPTSGSGIGLNLTRSSNAATNYLNITSTTFSTWGSHGVSISNAIVSTFSLVKSESNGGHGFYFHGDAGVAGTSVAMNGCYANANTASGYYFNTMAYCSLSGCASEANAIDYNITNCQAVSCTGCGSENNNGVGWLISGGYGVGLYSCWLYKNNGIGVHITGAAVAATVVALVDNTPGGSATACMQVDSGCTAVSFNVHNTTANSYATGTTQVFNDTAGGSVFTGGLTLQSTLGVSGDANFLGNAHVSGELDIGADTNLYRVSANVLATDDGFTAGGNMHTYSDATADGQIRATGGIGVGNSLAATTPGAVTKKIEIFDQNGASLGFIPVYNSIT
jgi:hypothetical protein